MPEGTAITLTATATNTANTNTAYKIEHYLMNTSGTYPTTATLSENKTGTTDSTLTLANIKNTTATYNVANGIIYSHGTVNGTQVTTTKISGNGSTVIKLYYKRTHGTLTVKAGDYVSDVKNGSTSIKDKAVTYYYGATVPAITATLNSTAGYTFAFSSFTSSNTGIIANSTANPKVAFTWPAMADGTAITLTAKATRTPVVYTLTLNGQNATTAGTTAIYEKYATGIYREAACTTAMTTTTNAITKPQRTYKVTFNANGGTCSTASANGTYTFNGYYTSTGGSGTQMINANGFITSNLTTTKYTAGTTFYAYWTGGSVTLPTPTRTGYNFDGWYTAASGGSKVTSYTPTAAATLYAHWSPKVLTITLNKNGGTTDGTTAIYEKYATGIYKEAACTTAMSTSANPITKPSRTGYTFAGFYDTSAATGGTQMINANGYITTNLTTTKYSANTTLYARWTVNNYTLTRTATTGGSVAGSSGSIAYGTSCTVTATASSGYKFMGWYEGTTKKSSSASYTFTMPAKNYTIQAKFQIPSIDYVALQISPGGPTINYSQGTITGFSPGWKPYFQIPGEGYQFKLNSGCPVEVYSSSSITGSYTKKVILSAGQTYVTTSSDKYIYLYAIYSSQNTSPASLEVNLIDGSNCTINDIENYYPKLVQYMDNFTGTLITSNGVYTDYFNTRSGIISTVYIPLANFYTFLSTESGTNVYYSSTIGGTYSYVGSVANSSLVASKAGYYRFQGSSMKIDVDAPSRFFMYLRNGLPKVTILSETTGNSGSTSHAGNKITITSGTTIFKPTITCNMTYDCGASLTLSRSTAQNGTYTQLSSYGLGTNGKHTSGSYNSLTSSYYYKLNGANSYVYLKDTAGSAVQFVQ